MECFFDAFRRFETFIDIFKVLKGVQDNLYELVKNFSAVVKIFRGGQGQSRWFSFSLHPSKAWEQYR